MYQVNQQPRVAAIDHAMTRLYVMFALSGAAGLIYEVVWFQFLRFTVGANAQTLAVLLACFMGGLFIGSAFAARLVSPRRDAFVVYAWLEIGIAVCGALLPLALGAIRELYFSIAETGRMAMALRLGISVTLLLPPTILMGATFPVLTRVIHPGAVQGRRIGLLYAANIVGAVAGALGAAFVLVPALTYSGANWLAVALNVFVAAIAWTLAGRSREQTNDEPTKVAANQSSDDLVGAETIPGLKDGSTSVYLAYALSGCAALAFEVLWSRLLGVAFGATVYAFASVLGVFLFGLAVGSAWASRMVHRMRDARRALAAVQILVIAAVSGTALLAPWASIILGGVERRMGGSGVVIACMNLIRTALIVMPGSILFGMAFPIALRALGQRFSDSAAVVGRLYAFNTVGAVVGSLATGFVLFPQFGSQTATAQLVLLPLAATCVLWLPSQLRIAPWIIALVAVGLTFFTPLPSRCAQVAHNYIYGPEALPNSLFIFGIPLLIGVFVILIKHVRFGWAYSLAIAGAMLAFSTQTPAKFYVFGWQYGRQGLMREFSDIVYFDEGVMAPVAVFYGASADLQVSINSRICASSSKGDMQLERMIGHVPVLLSRDPSDCVVVGLGAGVTSGAVASHPNVKRVWIAELEPKVVNAAAHMAAFNQDVVHDPKVTMVFDDGRHFIASSNRKFGVITSDPIHPRVAGAAALFTADYFALCRDHLIDGGVFAQWIGLYELTDEGLRSIVAAFAEAFPDGTLWMTATDALLVGSPGPLTIDVEHLRDQLSSSDPVRDSLAFINVRDAEDIIKSMLCTCDSLGGYLAGAPINRDANLYLQFSAGLNWQQWHHAELITQFAALRDFPDQILTIPPGERDTFLLAIEKRWRAFEVEYIEPQRQQLGLTGTR